MLLHTELSPHPYTASNLGWPCVPAECQQPAGREDTLKHKLSKHKGGHCRKTHWLYSVTVVIVTTTLIITMTTTTIIIVTIKCCLAPWLFYVSLYVNRLYIMYGTQINVCLSVITTTTIIVIVIIFSFTRFTQFSLSDAALTASLEVNQESFM